MKESAEYAIKKARLQSCEYRLLSTDCSTNIYTIAKISRKETDQHQLVYTVRNIGQRVQSFCRVAHETGQGHFLRNKGINHRRLTSIYICKGVWGLITQPARIKIQEVQCHRVGNSALPRWFSVMSMSPWHTLVSGYIVHRQESNLQISRTCPLGAGLWWLPVTRMSLIRFNGTSAWLILWKANRRVVFIRTQMPVATLKTEHWCKTDTNRSCWNANVREL